MLVRTHRWNLLFVALLIPIAAPSLDAQRRVLPADSLQLRHMRIRAYGTDACTVRVSTSGSMNIDTDISPANVRRWIDTAATYAAARPRRAKGQEIRYAWIPITLGIERTITDRLDAFEFVIGGREIPIRATEIPRITKLLRSAATQTLEQSKGECPTAPDR